MTFRQGLPLIGRRGELGMLEHLLQKASSGNPRAVLLCGEPGSGKTRLIREFVDGLPKRALVMRGGCRPGASPPLGPFAEAFRVPLRSTTLVAEELRPALESLREPGGLSRNQVFEAVLAFIADLEQPAVLVLDDLQWADQATWDLVTFLARNLRFERLLLILLCRNESPQVALDAADEIRRVVSLSDMAVARFTEQELIQAFQSARDRRPDTADLDLLRSVSGGLPFYVEQLLTAEPGQVPDAVLTLLRQEVAQLDPSARELAALVAVAGGELGIDLAEAAIGEPQASAAIAQSQRVRILERTEQSLALRHNLYRDVLVEDLDREQRRAMHVQLAVVGQRFSGLDQPGADAPEIAEHWIAAGQPRRAIPALATAARRAEAALAFEDAAALWAALIELLEPAAEDHELLLEALAGAADAARWNGRVDDAVRLITRALNLTSADERTLRATYHARRAAYHRICGAVEDAAWDADHAVGLLTDHDPAILRATVIGERARLTVLLGKVSDGQQQARQALRLAQEAQDSALEGRALSTLGVAQVYAGDLDAGIASLQEGRRLSSTYGTFEDAIRATNNLAFALLDDARWREGLAAATEAVELARRAGVDQHGGAAMAEDNAILALISLGRWTEAIERIDQLLAGEPVAALQHGWLLGMRVQLSAARGDFDEARTHLATLGRLSLQDPTVANGRVSAEAELALWAKEPDLAAEVTARQLSSDMLSADRVEMLIRCVRALADLGRGARLRGNTAAADAYADRAADYVARYAPQLDSKRAAHRLSRAVLLAELERARGNAQDAPWAEVIGLAAGQPFDAAYGRYRRAEVLLQSADPRAREEAGSLLALAVATARDLGAAPLRQDVETLAGRNGLVLAAIPTSSATASLEELNLTQREREVLAYLCQGLTNRKIGKMLHISDRTAAVHVSNILAKLGVANRTAAAAVAHELGL